MTTIGDRVTTSYDILGHPQSSYKSCIEGIHFEVLAYTDWADQFIPTTVKWITGIVDDFSDARESRFNALDANRLAFFESKVVYMTPDGMRGDGPTDI